MLYTKIAYILEESDLCIACFQAEGARGNSEGLVIVAGIFPVTESLTDVAVRPFTTAAAMIGGVRWRVWRLRLRGTVLCVVKVEAVANVAENTWRRFLLLFNIAKTWNK